MNVEYEGSKMFVPATLVVHQGDHVKIKVVNNIKSDPNQHGFAIPDYKIEKVVTRGEPQEVEFDAKEAAFSDQMPASSRPRRGAAGSADEVGGQSPTRPMPRYWSCFCR